MSLTRFFFLTLLAGTVSAASPLAWPPVTQTAKPWARNWWHGCAVDEANLRREFARYAQIGIGGLDIIPIYGVQGNEANDIEYLSPAFDQAFQWAASAAEENGMGIGICLGMGWCFGGPQIKRNRAGWRHEVKVFTEGIDADQTNRLPKAEIAAIRRNGKQVFVLLAKNTGKPMTKRTGKGGAGPMINPFDPQAMRDFLQPFSERFLQIPNARKPKFTFHDSWEYGINWSQSFREDFRRLRGYDLYDELPAFAGKSGDRERDARVLQDVRATYSDMTEETFVLWKRWNQARGILSVNQAHGAPANLLDFYALSDIPSTEMFRNGGRTPLVSRFNTVFFTGDRDPLVTKFAASAANLNGTRLVASEFATWLSEHFNETMEEAKCLADLQFLCGVNHLFWHGICYSPDGIPWPGRLFYASTELNPRNPLWRDWGFLNDYLTRAQSMFQSATPDMDVLLYWPVFDLWAKTGGGAMQSLSVSNSRRWLGNSPFGKISQQLWDGNIGFDSVSDRLLEKLTVQDGVLVASGKTRYRVLLIPPVSYMPETTMQRIAALAKSGANVIFADGKLPDDVPGLRDVETRRQKLREAADTAKGHVTLGDAFAALTALGIRPHPETQLKFLRQRYEGDTQFFLSNMSLKPFDGAYTLYAKGRSVVALDALTGQTGILPHTPAADGGKTVSLFLPPGASIFLRVCEQEVQGPRFLWTKPGAKRFDLAGPWEVCFLEGGPTLPKTFTQQTVASWVKNGDPETERFAGTAVYKTSFTLEKDTGDSVLDLGMVEASARVRVDGHDVGHAILLPYTVYIPAARLSAGKHTLEVEVTSPAANRIRDLDKRGVKWRIFKDINFADVFYKGFNAANWPVKECGLQGPVTLYEAEG